MKYRYPNSGPALQLSDFAITTEPPTTLRVNIFILLVAGRSREYRCVSGSADRPLSQSQSHHRYSGTAGTGTLYLSSLAGAWYRTRYGARAGVAVLLGSAWFCCKGLFHIRILRLLHQYLNLPNTRKKIFFYCLKIFTGTVPVYQFCEILLKSVIIRIRAHHNAILDPDQT